MSVFIKPNAIELARIVKARNGRKKFNVFIKPKTIKLV